MYGKKHSIDRVQYNYIFRSVETYPLWIRGGIPCNKTLPIRDNSNKGPHDVF